MELSSMNSDQLAEHFASMRTNQPVETQNQTTEQPQVVEQTTEEVPTDTVEQTTEDQQEGQVTEDTTPPLSEDLTRFFDEFDQKLFTNDLLSPFRNEDGTDYVRPRSLDDIAELIKANKESWIEEARETDKEALLQEIFSSKTPAFQFIAQNAHHFSSPEELIPLIQSVQAQDEIFNFDLEKPEDQEQIVRVSLSLQGLDSQSIEEEIADLKERDKLEGRAAKLKPSLDKYTSDRTEAILQEQAKKNYENQVFWNTYYTRLNEGLMNAKDIDGMNISREHRGQIASALVPNPQTGGLPIYDLIDKLVGDGDIAKLTKIAMLASDDKMFDSYYGAKKATQVARTLQKTLRTNVVSNSTQETRTPTPAKQKAQEIGYGVFLNK